MKRISQPKKLNSRTDRKKDRKKERAKAKVEEEAAKGDEATEWQNERGESGGKSFINLINARVKRNSNNSKGNSKFDSALSAKQLGQSVGKDGDGDRERESHRQTKSERERERDSGH